MKSFACRDVGMQCDWTTTGESDQEILDKASLHGADQHGIQSMTTEMIDKVRGAIKNVTQASDKKPEAA